MSGSMRFTGTSGRRVLFIFVQVIATLIVACIGFSAVAQVGQDRAVLEALYDATGGDAWKNNTNWKVSGTAIDTWFGVTVDSDGRVSKLSLRLNELSGEIPTELGDLTNLRHLSLRSNELSGEIPTELGDLTNLEDLDLAFNGLISGEIPTELGNLTKLRRLDFDNNMLSGEIPSELGNLIHIEQFGLDGNRLSGEIPAELGNLANVRFIDIDENNLSGEIPTELGNLTKLGHLDIRYNEGLTGELPPGLLSLYNQGRLVAKVEGTGITLPPPPSPSVIVDPSSLDITEGGGVGRYTMRLATRPTGNVTVTVDVPSGTDVTVDPQELVFTYTDWYVEQTVEVMSIGEDGDAVKNPVITLTHLISGGDYDSISVPDVMVTITENDVPALVTPEPLVMPKSPVAPQTPVTPEPLVMPELPVTPEPSVTPELPITLKPPELAKTEAEGGCAVAGTSNMAQSALLNLLWVVFSIFSISLKKRMSG